MATPEALAQEKSKSIQKAKDILDKNGKIPSGEQFTALYKSLVRHEQFGYACEIILKKIECKPESKTIQLHRDLALCIYKDMSLSSHFKYDRALKELEDHADLLKNNDSETLSMAGAIYKRRWQFDNQYNNLLLSENYYQKGYEVWTSNLGKTGYIDEDNGYSGINYAFVSELLAIENLEESVVKMGLIEPIAKRYQTAREVRQKVVDYYQAEIESNPKKAQHKWVNGTLAEACFGLLKYDEAQEFITRYLEESPDSWEVRSFGMQLVQIAHSQLYAKKILGKTNQTTIDTKLISTDAIDKCLAALGVKTDHHETKQATKFYKDSKVGLALSGGGFRAALFHIGVLAALAEKNELKDIEVLSCVSGGSIIGTYYYLKLKELLETTPDLEIEHSQYIELVATIEKDFLEAVQTNIRWQLFTHFFLNFKMVFLRNYSRTYRLGELYEQVFYSKIFEKSQNKSFKALYLNEFKAANDPENKPQNDRKIFIRNLRINPATAENAHGFDLKNDNWKRVNKVPQLILNATTVNTGHNWQFTASWMGEPPTYISNDFDVKQRLRRMYYPDAPETRYQDFRLGYCVAASSCVPVLFQPLNLDNLYGDKKLELIDGGLHDNQGINSIVEQECKNIIISDASGQLAEDFKKTASNVSLFYRTDNIVQERVRELQFADMKSKKAASNQIHLTTVHLKNELNSEPADWTNCKDVARKVNTSTIKKDDEKLTYGIVKKIQVLLSKVRTDLDSHNDLESYALMYSGYAQMIHAGNDSTAIQQGGFKFKEIAPLCTDVAKSKKLEKQLTISQQRFFKPLYFIPHYRIVKTTLLVIALLALILFIVYLFWFSGFNWGKTFQISGEFFRYGILMTIAIPLLVAIIKKIFRIKNIAFLSLAPVIWLLSWMYLYPQNLIYNRLGKFQNKQGKKPAVKQE